MRCHYMPIRIDKIKKENLIISNGEKDLKQQQSPIHCCCGWKMIQLNWKQFGSLLKLSMYNPIIPLLDIYPNEFKTYNFIKTCMQIL